MCDCNNPNPFVNPCDHLAAEIGATPVKPVVSPLSIAIRAQAARMRAKQTRRDNAARNGYRGPLTRNELAALAAKKFASK